MGKAEEDRKKKVTPDFCSVSTSKEKHLIAKRVPFGQ
jgi:hypothetical protein